MAATLRRSVILILLVAGLTVAVFAASPTINGLSPTSARVGMVVTITGANFGSTKGTSTVTFNGTPATTFSSWSANSIKTAVPSGATSGKVVVTVGGVASNGVAFTVAIGGGIIR